MSRLYVANQPMMIDWTDPRPGRIDATAWSALAMLSESATLTCALECARRGDAQSLTELVQVLREVGSGPATARGEPMTLMQCTPDYEAIDAESWEHDSCTLPTRQVAWEQTTLEGIIVVCLSRVRDPASPTRAVLPRTQAHDQCQVLPDLKAQLQPDERALLEQAVLLYDAMPPGNGAPAMSRLLGQVCRRLACPQALEVFTEAGVDLSKLADAPVDLKIKSGQAIDPVSHAIEAGNPTMARALIQAAQPGCGLSDLSAPLAESLARQLCLAHLVRHPSSHGASSIVFELLSTAGDDRQVAVDPRFEDLSWLCRAAIESGGNNSRMFAFVNMVGAHLSYCSLSKSPWCRPFIEALCDSGKTIPAQLWKATDQNLVGIAGQWLDGAWILHCAPVLEVMEPLMAGLLERPGYLPAGKLLHRPRTALHMVAAPVTYVVEDGQEHWARLVQLLDRAGYEPLAPVSRHRTRPITASTESESTTLLHMLADCKDLWRDGQRHALGLMLDLVDRGMDPQSRDWVGKTPCDRLPESVRGHWEAAWRSLLARKQAQAALADLLGQAAPQASI